MLKTKTERPNTNKKVKKNPLQENNSIHSSFKDTNGWQGRINTEKRRGINLIKQVKDFFNENYKTLKKM